MNNICYFFIYLSYKRLYAPVFISLLFLSVDLYAFSPESLQEFKKNIGEKEPQEASFPDQENKDHSLLEQGSTSYAKDNASDSAAVSEDMKQSNLDLGTSQGNEADHDQQHQAVNPLVTPQKKPDLAETTTRAQLLDQPQPTHEKHTDRPSVPLPYDTEQLQQKVENIELEPLPLDAHAENTDVSGTHHPSTPIAETMKETAKKVHDANKAVQNSKNSKPEPEHFAPVQQNVHKADADIDVDVDVNMYTKATKEQASRQKEHPVESDSASVHQSNLLQSIIDHTQNSNQKSNNMHGTNANRSNKRSMDDNEGGLLPSITRQIRSQLEEAVSEN